MSVHITSLALTLMLVHVCSVVSIHWNDFCLLLLKTMWQAMHFEGRLWFLQIFLFVFNSLLLMIGWYLNNVIVIFHRNAYICVVILF